ncbi:hypothetical protein GGD56_006782 [Rhizobium mongolense]|uniref:Uncharacterized protein n=1 Tax=Rhizobium mongolense TaxID=57676 RepID=A0ABR6IY89_9HYPH|nr:hypothetical protein [Rhizobium mongolense]
MIAMPIAWQAGSQRQAISSAIMAAPKSCRAAAGPSACATGARCGVPIAIGQEPTRDGVTREYSERNNCEYREYVARPLRAQPYHFDIKSAQDGKTERHYFDLKH